MIVYTTSVQETQAFGEKLGRLLKPGDLICLAGTLGAGKTTLTTGIARGWGAQDAVSSPTFTLINEYRHSSGDAILYHIDAYRLEGDLDALSTGLEDVLAGECMVVLEWPERIIKLLPNDRVWVSLNVEADGSRKIHLEASGPRAKVLLDNLTTN